MPGDGARMITFAAHDLVPERAATVAPAPRRGGRRDARRSGAARSPVLAVLLAILVATSLDAAATEAVARCATTSARRRARSSPSSSPSTDSTRASLRACSRRRAISRESSRRCRGRCCRRRNGTNTRRDSSSRGAHRRRASQFWRDHMRRRLRARKSEFGVPAEVIVAIIGVETFYGRNTGQLPRHRRADHARLRLSATRANSSASELKQFLLLTREQGISPLAPKGSYAGRIGPAAVHARQRSGLCARLRRRWPDRPRRANRPTRSAASRTICARHGWQPGAAGAGSQARVDPAGERSRVAQARRRCQRAARRSTPGCAMAYGALPADPGSDPVGLLMLEEAGGPSLLAGVQQLVRARRATTAAGSMRSAVWQLAQALESRRAARRRDRADSTEPTPPRRRPEIRILARAIQRIDVRSQTERRCIGAGRLDAALQRAEQRRGQRLAQLDAPLIERIDTQQHAFDESPVLVAARAAGPVAAH